MKKIILSLLVTVGLICRAGAQTPSTLLSLSALGDYQQIPISKDPYLATNDGFLVINEYPAIVWNEIDQYNISNISISKKEAERLHCETIERYLATASF